ncbi:hypothetical protein MJO28_008468 [Puccinia striiformis f. sp. tritici]|uniref:Uncharacterized protein n=1 Tax=Puccinia striiformis f. sp. tritici TaxID=168172 RepID=A0ACC0ECT9_9BASI|nr:hypothetical protein MJO28_008468 [Puccinia striiformis f. sp. tritici]
MVGTSSALADDFSQSTPADLTIVLQGADDPWGTPIWLRRAQTVADPQLKSTCSESLMAHFSTGFYASFASTLRCSSYPSHSFFYGFLAPKTSKLPPHQAIPSNTTRYYTTPLIYHTHSLTTLHQDTTNCSLLHTKLSTAA